MTQAKSTIIELDRVSLAASVGSNYLLQDITFSIDPGDRLAIIGSSGAGKTSLLRLLNGLNSPTTGSIYFQNQLLTQINPIYLRSQIVLVSQETKLLGMNVAEAIAYPLVLQKRSPREIQHSLQTWTTELKIPDDWLDRSEIQLSLGQRQLVSIARALMMQPKVLILDEPTSALDLGIANRLIDTLMNLAQRDRISIIMVNHQLELAQKFADRVIYLHQGKIDRDSLSSQLDWGWLRQEILQTQAKTVQEWLE